MRNQNDNQLIDRIQNGDIRAFDQLYRLHRDWVRGILSRYTCDRDETDDLLQIVFLKVYQGLHRFRGEAAFTTWLTRIALNVCTTHIRTRRAQQTLRLALERAWPDQPPPATPEDHLLLNERRRIIRHHLQALPETQRKALYLRYMEDLPYREIGHRLCVPEGTVKIWLYRGRHHLRRLLAQPQM